MDIREFVDSTVKQLDDKNLEELKEKLIGKYLRFTFVDESMISQQVFCEKLADYFEKTEIKTGNEFAKICTKYVLNLDEVVKQYIPKEPAAKKKGDTVPPMPRSIRYYKHALDIKGYKNLTMKQFADYSRIMMSLYMGAINAGMKEATDFEFSTADLDLNRIIYALKAEKYGLGPVVMMPRFNLEELYCTDTTTFVITIIMFYYIKNSEVEGEC